MSEKLVSEQQLTALQQLQTNFDLITKRYGELKFQSVLIEDEQTQLTADMRELEATRNSIVAQLQTDFGTSGQVNLQTGEFIPD